MGWGKTVVYWLCGESLGRRLVSSWNWLLGRALDEGGTPAVSNAQQAIADIKVSLLKFQEGVAAAGAAFERAKAKYADKLKEAETLQKQAQAAVDAGRDDLADTSLEQLLVIEEFLPQQRAKMEAAEMAFGKAKEALNVERKRLANMEFRLANMADQTEFDNAIGDLLKATNVLDVGSARNEFDRAEAGVQNRALKTKANMELNENPTETAQREVSKLSASSEIEKRKAAMRGHQRDYQAPLPDGTKTL